MKKILGLVSGLILVILMGGCGNNLMSTLSDSISSSGNIEDLFADIEKAYYMTDDFKYPSEYKFQGMGDNEVRIVELDKERYMEYDYEVEEIEEGLYRYKIGGLKPSLANFSHDYVFRLDQQEECYGLVSVKLFDETPTLEEAKEVYENRGGEIFTVERIVVDMN